MIAQLRSTAVELKGPEGSDRQIQWRHALDRIRRGFERLLAATTQSEFDRLAADMQSDLPVMALPPIPASP